MMGKRVLFICNTAYQLFTIVQLRLTEYKSDNVDIVLSNQFSNSARIVDNVKKSELFRHVLHIENRKQDFSSRIAETLHNVKILRKLRKHLGQIDEVCFSNISVFTILFLRFYQKKAPKVCIFEDGFVTYSKAFEEMDQATIFSKLLLPKGVLNRTSKLWLFSPELLDWQKKNIAVCKIKPVDKNDKSIVDIFNRIFGYETNVDRYDKPYLFMEESFFADGYSVDDLKIVKGIADKVGKENLMVKLHPRNSENRFEALGIKTNSSFAIPWELIVLNQNFENYTLISISSSSILQPFLLFGMPIKCYALLGTLGQRPGNMNGTLGDYMESLFSRFPNVCICPNNLEDFYEMIRTE